MATYDDLRDNLDTGDIVLFSGKGLISMGLRIGSLCSWSHVAMVVRARELDVALLYQTTPVCKAKDFFEGTLKNGVQINVMSEAVNGYNGKVAVRHLSVARTSEMLNSLSRFRQEVKDRPYEAHIIQMVKAVWEGPLGHVEEDLSILFCSELEAEASTSVWGCFHPMNAAAVPVRNTSRKIFHPKAVASNCFWAPRLARKL